MARRCCDEFDIAMNTLFVHEFLQKPTMEDLMAIATLHQSKHRVPGMFGSLDCMHTVWKNCPMAWHGSYQGKEKARTLVFATTTSGSGMPFMAVLVPLMTSISSDFLTS
jgi:Plant transposon protein